MLSLRPDVRSGAARPEFGHRFLVGEACAAGWPMCERTAWRLCHDHEWWSAFGRKRGRNGKRTRRPVHDDVVQRQFTATAANRLWLTDITEHPTGEGTLYLCAVKDAYVGRIVGYSVDSRMKARLAVAALEHAVARRGEVAGCIVHSDRGSEFGARKYLRVLTRHGLDGSMGRVGAAADNAAVESFFALLQATSWIASAGPRDTPTPGDRHLDRMDLPPPPPPTTPRAVDP